MNTYLKILLLLLLPSVACSQEPENLSAKRNQVESFQTAEKFNNYRAIHWGIEDGLSHGDASQMIKDTYGFLWVGTTNGLNRFDGTTFRIFYHDLSNPKSIPDDFTLLGLNEDSLHNIWIGTSKGLARYDIRADTFTNLSDNSFGFPFWATKNEMLCIEKGASTISAYNIYSLKRKTLASLGPYAGMFNGNAHGFVFDEATNWIWFPVNDQAKNFSGLMQLNLSSDGKQFFSWPCYRKIAGHDHSIEGICYDKKRNCIWINSNDGLLQFTLSDKQFHHVDALDKLPDLKGFEKAFDLWHWVGIDIDKKNRIWVATVQKGIVAYDPDTQIAFQPFSHDSSLAFDVSDRNACVYCDRDGIVWCGNWRRNGIYQLNPFSEAVKTYVANPSDPKALSGPLVNEILKADHGKVWIGTQDSGLNVFDPHMSSFEVLRKNDLPGIRENALLPLAIDSSSQKAWLLSRNDGIYEMDMQTKKCRPVILRDGDGTKFQTHQFHGTCAYKKGFIECIAWQKDTVGVFVPDSNSKQGIFFINSHSNVAQLLVSLPWEHGYGLPTLAQNDHLLFLKADQNPAANLTFSDYKGKWVRTSTPLDSILWERVFYNKIDDSYWVVTFQKLIHYDKNFRVVSEYTKRNGLPDIPIFSLIFDKHNNVWFNTDRSIFELNIMTGTILRLSEKDGFQPQNFSDYTPVAKDDDGDLYFAVGFYGNGFYRIHPDKFVSPPSSVYLHSILVNDRLLPLTTGVNNLQTLSLKYFQNKITIETGVIDYYSKGKNQIRYKLEGLNDAWQYAPAYYTIRFDGLRAANYKLIVQAASPSNEFNGPEKTLTIIISPPFWETWWFRIFSVVAMVFVVYAIVQQQSRKLKKRNVVLEEKVIHRTKELKHSLEELRSTQTQLIQQEKMASLGELTAGIAHEIQNPLNFVNNFSDVNRELIDELNAERSKPNAERDENLESEILNDIRENEQKINHHGKRADAIVKGMLQHSRASGGHKEPTDINALADEYLRLAYHGIKAKDKLFNAITKTEFDNGVGKINIVPQDIGRVILNLINNAFYAVNEKQKQNIPDFEPTVTVTTKKLEDKVLITVADNGNGIPQKIVDKIFQPFFTTKPTGQGTGLGLSLAYDIVKAHGGEIKVETKEGEGTTFIIHLPS